MRRRLFTIFAAISLLLCICLLALWLRSYRHLDDYKIWQIENDRLCELLSLRGGIQLARVECVSQWLADDMLHANQGWHTFPTSPDDDWQLFAGAGTADFRNYLGFRFASGRIGALAAVRFWSIRIPFWPLALLSAVLPTWWLCSMVRAWTRTRRLRLALCPTCAYDLRATPNQCPECGSPVPTRNQQQVTTNN
ncbi:MAG: hypothetical protein NTU53_09105 [Planctomycetota bacterium]|nr:hypothetical protein [Planctomycetota bacterium]